jgi:SOS-response transcriptional repressor LexA
MLLSKKFKGAREAAGLSQGGAAAALNVTQGYVSHIETGRRLSLPPDLAKKAAKLLGLPAGDLDEYVSEQGRKATSEVGRYKVHGTVAAGRGIDDEADGDQMVSLPERCDGADGVYLVAGLSMRDAGILPGDYLVVRRTDTPADGELVVAWTGEFGAVVKRVGVSSEGDVFARLRTEYVLLTEGDDKDRRYPYTMQLDRGDRIYAVVIAVFREYKAKGKAAPSRPSLKPVTAKGGTPALKIKPKGKK